MYSSCVNLHKNYKVLLTLRKFMTKKEQVQDVYAFFTLSPLSLSIIMHSLFI